MRKRYEYRFGHLRLNWLGLVSMQQQDEDRKDGRESVFHGWEGEGGTPLGLRAVSRWKSLPDSYLDTAAQSENLLPRVGPAYTNSPQNKTNWGGATSDAQRRRRDAKPERSGTGCRVRGPCLFSRKRFPDRSGLNEPP